MMTMRQTVMVIVLCSLFSHKFIEIVRYSAEVLVLIMWSKIAVVPTGAFAIPYEAHSLSSWCPDIVQRRCRNTINGTIAQR